MVTGVNGEKGQSTLSSVGRAEHSEGTPPAEDSHRALAASLHVHSGPCGLAQT